MVSAGIWHGGDDENGSAFLAACRDIQITDGDDPASRAFASGRPVWVEDCSPVLSRRRAAAAREAGLRAGVAFPVLIGSRVVAVLEFYSFDDGEHDTALMQALSYAGTQIGRVVERRNSEHELLAAKDEAERANMAKSKFLAAASHDLRQPMQALNLFVNVLSSNLRDDDGAQDIVGQIKESVRSLEGLLHALLNISKLEAGLVVPEITSFSMNDLFRRLKAEFDPLAERAGLRLGVVPSNVIIRSDPVLIERILRNLLSNAIRYTDHGGVLLGCRRRHHMLRIEVWDTGVGIPAEKQKAVFQDFYQIPTDSEDRAEGLGLGLAIVERLTRLLAHRLDLRSVPDRGSVFAVEVPTATAAETTEETAMGDGTVPLVPIADHAARGVVMVIDDEPAVLKAMTAQLEAWGHKVVAAASIDEAVKMVGKKKRAPDLIIADYRLGKGETGDKAIKVIRKKLGSDVPGVLFSGDTAPKRLRKAQKSGLSLLHKPVPPDDLYRVVAKALQSSK